MRTVMHFHARETRLDAADLGVQHAESQDVPCSMLTVMYMLSSRRPPSVLVLLSFATSLTYLGSVR
jgi:hypothetical protein